MTGLQDSRIVDDGRFAGRQGYQDGRMAGWQDGRVAGWQDIRMVGWQDNRKAG
jgi:hypothetical protein